MSFMKRTKETAKAEMLNKYSKDKVVCDTRELKQHITDWCHNDGQKFDVIANVLEAVGFSMPVQLSDFNKKCTPAAFKCIDDSGKKANISLIWGDFIDFCSGVIVTTEESGSKSIKSYDVSFDHSIESQDVSTPILNLTCNVIFVGNLTIRGHFGWWTCDFEVEVDESHRLQIEIGKSDEDCDGQLDSTWGSKYSNEMLAYLSKFDFKNFDVDELYAGTTKIMHLEGSDIHKIFIKDEEAKKDHTKCMGESSRCLAMISVHDDVVDRYAYMEDGKSFFVSESGDWSYSTENCEIKYSKYLDKLSYSVSGSEEEISKINLPELISSVKEKLRWDKVGL